MDNLIVCYNGIYWPKYEQNQLITTENCPTSTTAYQLMHIYNTCPLDTVNYCNKRRVMIQAGGNAGYYVKKYSELFDYVYTFEPLPLLFYCLNLNVTSSNVYKFNCCLGNKNECVSMNDESLTLGHGGSHVNIWNNILPKTVPTIKIDNLNLQICDLIQLDLEGYEFNALLGGVETIKRCKPVIVIEDYSAWAERYESSLSKIEDLLFSLNYVFIDKIISNGDCVYKHKENL
jgi:FkbM family methyltransferase